MSDERTMLAAEFALGTLPANERDAALRLRTEDVSFDRAVRDWEQRLAPLVRHIAEATPSTQTWDRVLARIGGVRDAARSDPSAGVVVLQRGLRRWRTTALLTGTLAAALALFALDRDLLRGAPTVAPGAYFAAINRGGEMPALIVRVDLATHMVTVRPVEAQTPPGKSLELWYVGAGQAPKSMGLVGKERERRAMPDAVGMQGAAFAVSVEPIGGSPTGAPTGPVVYKGALVAE